MPSPEPAQLASRLADYGDIRLATLFGSTATGRARPDSDIDIAIEAEQPLSTTRKMEIINDLAVMAG